MSQPESWLLRTHTPNWPEGEDDTRFDTIVITVKIKCDTERSSLNRKDVDKICAKLEKAATGKSRLRTVSALL